MNRADIIKIAVEAAAEYMDKQRQKLQKSRHDKRLRNTKLLLRNYNLFKNHCNKSIYRLDQAISTENAIDILDALSKYDGDAYVESIKKSVVRTHIILTHIDTMMELYKIYCNTSTREEDKRRFRILNACYFEGVRMTEIIEAEHIDERTYYRDMKDACEKLSALIFGIDGMSEMSETCQ